MKKIRLFIAEKDLCKGTIIKLSNNDFDYLVKVMRQREGGEFCVFNGTDGEFVAHITEIKKKYLTAQIGEKIAELRKVPNITLAFALVKNVRIDFVAQKSTELGVAKFQPILTQRSIVDKINHDRFKSNVKEACEQCERNDFPEISDLKKLEKLLNEEEMKEKILILCDESGKAGKASEVLSKINNNGKEIVILTGPEGGFSEDEFAKMRKFENLFSISLGPRILRADTAMISALTLVQEFLGDSK